MMGRNTKKAKRNRKRRGKKDLTLSQVERLKDRMQRHVRDLNRLLGKKRNTGKEGFGSSSEAYSSDDNEAIELRKRIAHLKKLLRQNGAILRGEDGAADEVLNENEVVGSKLWELKED